ncbi:MAG: restriction endonuclease [Polyangiales bacterium]
MKFEVLVRHIEAADPQAFRELALVCLTARGFQAEVTDGPDDGGRDLRIFSMPPGARRFAVQVSVEKDWRTKLRDDALLAKDKLGVTDMLFVSSRRLAEVDFQTVQDELVGKGVAVQKMDAQGIASLLHARGLIPKALEVLALWEPVVRSEGFERPDMRVEVAWSYAFFGVEPATFRTGVIERAILTVAAHAGGSLPLADVVDRVSLSLGLARNQREQVKPAVDRLRQRGALEGTNGTVKVPEVVLHEQDALRVLRKRSHDELVLALADALKPWIRTAPRRATLAQEIVADVSALLLDDARVTSASLTHERSAEAFTEATGRMRRLAATLVSFGLDDADDHRTALVAICEAARQSSLGRFLLAGEVFVNLVSLRTSQLMSAIGSRRALRAVLDASVAMPLLAGLLYEPVAQRYSLAARHAYDQFASHGVDVMIPSDHVEEMAAHLLDAWSYRDLLDVEPDLKASQNAFVSHFLGLRAKGVWTDQPVAASFARYLDGFGFKPSHAAMDFVQARELLQRRIEASLARYHLRTERLPVPASAMDDVRKAFDRILDEWRISARLPLDRTMRPEVLLRHDARTVAWLHTLPATDATATVFCTWDRLIFDLHEQASPLWEALTPAQLGDALALAAPDDNGDPPVSVLDIALSLADEDAERGASVLDRIVRIEKGGLHDAELLTQARRFKEDWLRSSHPRPFEDAWAEWKRAHLSARSSGTPEGNA